MSEREQLIKILNLVCSLFVKITSGGIHLIKKYSLKKLIILFFVIISGTVLCEEYLKGKIIERTGSVLENNIYTQTEISDEIKNIEVYKVKIGKEIIVIEQPIYNDNSLNIDFHTGDTVVVMKDADENGEMYFVTDVDKRGDYLVLSLGFIFMTIILAKLKGVKALFALGISVVAIFYFFIPLVIKGYSPIFLSVITALFSSVITIYFVTGFNKKGITAILGSIGGVMCSGILSEIFVRKMALTGYSTIDAIGYAGFLQGIQVRELVSAGIILGSMGAVMDVAMSISSSLSEIKEKNSDLSPWELFKSGIHIGSDVVGTMINTLILAYIGSSLFDMIIISIHIQELPMIRLLNYEFIAVEILKSFSGSIGILAAIPLTAYLSSYMGTGKNIFKDRRTR